MIMPIAVAIIDLILSFPGAFINLVSPGKIKDRTPINVTIIPNTIIM